MCNPLVTAVVFTRSNSFCEKCCKQGPVAGVIFSIR